VIDDRPEHCTDVKTLSRARPLLVWRQDPETAPPSAVQAGVQIVASAGAALEQLEEMTRRLDRRRGLLTRLREAIGVS
jgi:hypothetical protein